MKRTNLSPFLLLFTLGLLVLSGCKSTPEEPAPAPKAEEQPQSGESETPTEPETETPPDAPTVDNKAPTDATPTVIKRTPPARVRSVDDFMKEAQNEISSENYEAKLKDMERAVNNLERAVNQKAQKGGGFGR
jgi:hypothetical protein